MKLPQSITQPFSTRVFSAFTVAIFAIVLPFCAQAATQQLVSAPSSLRFGKIPIGQMETQLVVLTNGGNTSVSLSAVTLNGTEFSVSQTGLPLILSAGQSAALNVTFSPTATGWVGGTLTFTSNASNPQLLLALGGTGVISEAMTASPSTASFGNVGVGSSSTMSVVLTNNGASRAKLSAFQITGSGFSLSGPALPMTLSSGQSITLKLTFAPQSAGVSGGRVFVTGPALVIPLTGAGTASSQLILNPASVNFGDVPVGTTQTQPITISAAGASVTVSSDSSNNSQFALNGASLPLTIPAGQSMSFNVTFTPTGSGTTSGSLSFASNASNPQTLESLTGIGTVTQHSVNLWWNASTDVVGYNVYRSTSANGTYAKINSTLDLNTAYTDGAVVSGQTYYYGATAVNSSGQESTRSTPPVAASIP
jgi:Abnormal spindle-like microcephaly-assoc'd, ASPM-SPD-2-Hydin